LSARHELALTYFHVSVGSDDARRCHGRRWVGVRDRRGRRGCSCCADGAVGSGGRGGLRRRRWLMPGSGA
jgi:hypothetical protein